MEPIVMQMEEDLALTDDWDISQIVSGSDLFPMKESKYFLYIDQDLFRL